MAKKVFTDESLATFVDEIKSYTDGAVSTKANSSHTHSISNVTNLQSSLDAKVSTSTTVNGKALSSNITLSASDVGAATSGHTHSSYVNQNAFSNVKVGTATVAADTTTDTLEIAAGTGISVSGDATNDKVTITNSGVRSIATGSSNGTISVNTNGTSANVAVKGLGSAAYTASTAYDAAGTAQTKADAALASAKTYTDGKIDAIVGEGASETLDTIGEISAAIEASQDVVDALNAAIGNKVDKISGKGLSTNDYTTTEKNKLSGITAGAQVNQNAFSNVKVGSTTIAADSTTDTLTLVAGSNITLTPDATGDSVTIAAKDSTYTLGSFGVSATATELNYTDGVKSNIQAQLDDKASSSHSHTIAASASDDDVVVLTGTNGSNKVTYSASHADSGVTAGTYKSVTVNEKGHVTAGTNPTTLSGYGITDAYTKMQVDNIASGKANSSHGNHVPTTQTASNKVFLRNDNTWVTVTPANIGAAAASHGTHVTYGTSASALGTSSAGSASTVSRSDHVHALPALTSCTGTLSVAKGGTGATTAAAALTNLGVFDAIYPVGSIYMSVNNVNPGTLFGGTWTAWGSGCVPVGVDTAQTEFSTVEKTGGEKSHTLILDEMPKHSHIIPRLTGSAATVNLEGDIGNIVVESKNNYRPTAHGICAVIDVESGSVSAGGGATSTTVKGRSDFIGIDASHSHTVATNTSHTETNGSDAPHNNLPPYITCYMWKRTA